MNSGHYLYGDCDPVGAICDARNDTEVIAISTICDARNDTEVIAISTICDARYDTEVIAISTKNIHWFSNAYTSIYHKAAVKL